jgi:glutaconyl-CoA/methylmalonyl-CoA decarboxylase subunit gamma
MKKLRVTVDGKVFDVAVEFLDDTATPAAPAPVPARTLTAVTAPTSAPAAASAAPPVAGQGTVVCPLAGKVVSIDVAVGQGVAAGAQVATVEAMKMNTFVYAAAAGRVTAIHAKPGDAVEEGGALLTIS